MSSIEKRTTASGQVFWLARWRDPEGRQRAKSFPRRGDADRFMTTVAAEVLKGDYLDPDAGRETFESYARRWLAGQAMDPATHQAVELRLRIHAYPKLGSRELRSVRPSTVQAWLRHISESLSPSTVGVVFTNVSTVFAAAVDDDLIRKNPCRAASVRPPRRPPRRVMPWPAEQVEAVWAALPDRYAVVALLAAGLGLRQGEVFGLSPNDVDFLRGVVTVQRQAKIVESRLVYAGPKGKKVRSVPLPSTIRDDLSAYLARFPAWTVELPQERPGGKPLQVPLVVTSRERQALNRNYFNPFVWKPALIAAGVEPTRDNGCHALRHFYVSVLLDAGESIKAVSEYLGHADAGFTLRTYTHLLPASDERTRRAVDAVTSSWTRGNDVETGEAGDASA